ncbi:hypothetical protein [Legionella fallonii]|uniref:Uncharacterized protein n=1 Tax=Legionella fallonii LLAP-10 TaxID=1212491 RepID=A0A098G8D2_9GAMM|nr:hypothetical protein [Legionella fallonii]CEG57730.1 conserved exported protein of unknown function [Legionella fallonii LLAP-10]
MQIDGTLFLIRILLISFLLFLFALPMLSYGEDISNMRGKRYCEIVIAKSKNDAAVYNSFGLNDCPDDIWKKMNINDIRKETAAVLVRLNGPRYWVIDGLTSFSFIDPTIKTIGGLQMRQADEMITTPSDFFLVNIPYHPREVRRHTIWVYEEGKPVYELIDSKGHVFVMHSYSIESVPQTEQSLAELGSKLKLPPGWKFKTGILKKTMTLEAVNSTALVVRDNLMNAYQHSEKDLLQ